MPPDGAILDQVAGGSVQLNTFQRIEPNLALGVFSTHLESNRGKEMESNYAARNDYANSPRYDRSRKNSYSDTFPKSGYGSQSKKFQKYSIARRSRSQERKPRQNSYKGNNFHSFTQFR